MTEKCVEQSGDVTPRSIREKTELAIAVQNAVNAKLAYWDSLGFIEVLLRRDDDHLDDWITNIAIGVDIPGYSLCEARDDIEDLLLCDCAVVTV